MLIPQTTVAVSDENAVALHTIMEKLEDYDDVQEVYSNAQLEG
jgi:transcriptional/translational regulatory protein YebC/TACO1